MFSKFYIKFNYENIVPFNLKKKKLRVQANIIANKVAQSFFVGHQVKFWYYFFGINGLKRDNTILVKRFLNKKSEKIVQLARLIFRLYTFKGNLNIGVVN